MSTKRRRIVAPEASSENRSAVLNEREPNNSVDIETPEHRRAMARFIARKELTTIPDKVAGDPLFFRNYRWPEANKEYPEDTDAGMRFVSRYYPYADGGPLYVDQPKSLREVDRCEEKRKVMKKLRLRYVVITQEYFTPDGFRVEPTKLSEALEQLE